MVGAVDVGENIGLGNPIHTLLCSKEVVEAPADVPVACTRLHIPIGIGTRLLGEEVAEGVDVANVHHFINPRSLFGKEASVLFVLFRPGEIYFFVGSVHIPTEDDRLLFVQLLYELQEGIIEAEFIIEPLGPLAAVGEVGVHQPEVGIFCTNHAAFLVKFFNPHTVDDLQWFTLGVERDAAVALLNLTGREEARVVSGGEERFRELVGRSFGLLKTEDVWLRRLYKRSPEIILSQGAESVHIPRHDFHISILLCKTKARDMFRAQGLF